MTEEFYTPSKVAQILGVSHRCILERLAAGELEAEQDSCTGRWKIPKGSLDGSGAELLSEAEVAWQDEKALLLAELHRERARADKESERAKREQEHAARERKRAEGLRRRLIELNTVQSKGPRWKMFGR